MHALKLQPQPVPRIWGGTRLPTLLNLKTQEPIGEAWLAYETNRVAEGPHAGRTIKDLLPELGPAFLGPTPHAKYGLDLPLLVKLIDTADWLSVQVHPDDHYAHTHEAHTGYHGKTEAWYILDATPGAEIIYGLERPTPRETLAQAAQDGSIWNLLHRETVHPHQLIYTPAGTIHALGPGLLLYEIQQKSDLTYRLYDYGRGRELHLEKALDVARLEPTPIPQFTPRKEGPAELLLATPAFTLRRYTLTTPTRVHTPPESFALYTRIQGEPLGETLLVGAGQSVTLGPGVWLGAAMA
ncbi:type I phosphomannose isomerase catalytic subunit [Marinithermus hydrothermalis]|uniref:Mannose-6-phosphate isomerase n=1 Tax=Marinithermus hydrothermalis (strain DSM 14884 / JCM 11576 / T1) TaxID=869210 RepID=F2NQY9_MARHT|nr:type I phosphomannose isomerase catalytic subunit [Marinithermus hydrothermalis]AEB12567.1 Mannose-6-phosphate isomerase [Marinithermus hydrothermalis DSM 14884]